jgi:hypothetical protein
MKVLLEYILRQRSYDDMSLWHLPSFNAVSREKELWDYQKEALKAVTKLMYIAFSGCRDSRGRGPDKEAIAALYAEAGLKDSAFSIPRYSAGTDGSNRETNERWKFFSGYLPSEGEGKEEHIKGKNFLNRVCFWMATGSGKSIVLIKTIELLDYLINRRLIPDKKIMLLLPRQDLINQFKNEINGYNHGRERKIEFIDLSDYEDSISTMDVHGIGVYYYRSDLLRGEQKEAILDYKNYDNNGNWYVFLDEAHRGDKEDSNMQNYVTVLSRNGFLFNFSATFTEEIDYITTCYNFNLEKFITAEYGKNIYLSSSCFAFTKAKDEISEREKQKQILKSFITFTMIKKSRKDGYYHLPLMVTLVNLVNTKDSDLKLFFNEIEKIAAGSVDNRIFDRVKKELIAEYSENSGYQFGNETMPFDQTWIEHININDVQFEIFNTCDTGAVEWWKGEMGKEIILKLENTDKPFALIRIGDIEKFSNDLFGRKYREIITPERVNYFELLNNGENPITMLIGSRSFYEGWNSNRPNVINMINIGKKEAKKFVPQSIGRGVRIEPVKGTRKRLKNDSPHKNALLETLFIFATDKDSFKAIMETIENNKTSSPLNEPGLTENERPFKPLIPLHDTDAALAESAKFTISCDSKYRLREYIKDFNKNTLLLRYNVSIKKLSYLLARINEDDFFQINEDTVYYDMDFLFNRLILHINKEMNL